MSKGIIRKRIRRDTNGPKRSNKTATFFSIPDFPGKIKGSFLLILFKIYSRNISSNILIDDQLLDHNT